jgi:hypothetical protein lmonFR_13802|nr:MAG TPA: hypothetical protein [Caudoviricetes sp.]
MVYPKKEYALYKGDNLLKIGTAEELGIKRETVLFYKSPAYNKRTNPDKSLRLVALDEE